MPDGDKLDEGKVAVIGEQDVGIIVGCAGEYLAVPDVGNYI